LIELTEQISLATIYKTNGDLYWNEARFKLSLNKITEPPGRLGRKIASKMG